MIAFIRNYFSKKLLLQLNISYNSKNRVKKNSVLILEEGASVSKVTASFTCLEIGALSYLRSGTELLNVNSIGRFCSIGNEVIIGQQKADHPLDWVSSHPFQYTNTALTYKSLNNPATIGHDVWIGRGAMIMEGVQIGTGAVIAARSLVTRDVPPYAIIAGMPARIIKFRHSQETIDGLIKSAWWDLQIDSLLRLPLDHPEQFLASLQNIDSPVPASYRRIKITRNQAEIMT